MLSTSELLVLITGAIGAVASAIVTIYNGIKLKVIHQDTNGNLTTVRRELAHVRAQLQQPQARPQRHDP